MSKTPLKRTSSPPGRIAPRTEARAIGATRRTNPSFMICGMTFIGPGKVIGPGRGGKAKTPSRARGWLLLTSDAEVDRQIDEHANRASVDAGWAEHCTQHVILGGLVESRVRTLDDLYRRRFRPSCRVDDGLH